MKNLPFKNNPYTTLPDINRLNTKCQANWYKQPDTSQLMQVNERKQTDPNKVTQTTELKLFATNEVFLKIRI